MKLYCAFDKVSKIFQFPCAVENDDVAMRSFAGLAGSYQYFSDLELYCVGSFDMETGIITALPVRSSGSVPCLYCVAVSCCKGR